MAPLIVDGGSLRNAWRVSDSLCRSAQPTPGDWPAIAKCGVKSVLDLRETDEHSVVREREQVEGVGMAYLSHPLSDWRVPGQRDLRLILATIDDAVAVQGGSVLVHCKRGADRTGVVCACFQLSHGASTEEVFSDLHRGGLLEIWMLAAVVDFNIRSMRGEK